MSDVDNNEIEAGATEAPSSAPVFPLPGDVLREAREKAGLTPEQVAKDMLLDTQIIRAIEINRFGDLGAPVYAKGYLRRYARLVGVAEAGVVSRYETLQGNQATVDPVPVTHNVIPAPRAPLPRWVTWSVVVLVVLAGAVMLMREVPTPTTVDVAAPVAAPESNDSVATTVTPPLGETPLARGDALADAGASTATESTTVDSTPVGTTTTLTPPAAVAPITLSLRFSGDSWVEVYDANNKALLYDMGSPSAPREVSGTPPWRVTLGSANVVQIFINGQARELPADKVQANVAHFNVSAAGRIE